MERHANKLKCSPVANGELWISLPSKTVFTGLLYPFPFAENQTTRSATRTILMHYFFKNACTWERDVLCMRSQNTWCVDWQGSEPLSNHLTFIREVIFSYFKTRTVLYTFIISENREYFFSRYICWRTPNVFHTMADFDLDYETALTVIDSWELLRREKNYAVIVGSGLFKK